MCPLGPSQPEANGSLGVAAVEAHVHHTTTIASPPLLAFLYGASWLQSEKVLYLTLMKNTKAKQMLRVPM